MAPAEVVGTVRRLAAEKRRPPMTAIELGERFAKAGVLRFAARLEEGLTVH
ncbi:hypothetical protein [Streptomyces sp. RKND-216]|uniref:hypothetical protein n=1 Tax=Streptomyces sp. RKND-216 TaxID=2562581 RepID=UPI00144816F9|nr:hypothetical protein [Streptomyces sp. RKND-216]